MATTIKDFCNHIGLRVSPYTAGDKKTFTLFVNASSPQAFNALREAQTRYLAKLSSKEKPILTVNLFGFECHLLPKATNSDKQEQICNHCLATDHQFQHCVTIPLPNLKLPLTPEMQKAILSAPFTLALVPLFCNLDHTPHAYDLLLEKNPLTLGLTPENITAKLSTFPQNAFRPANATMVQITQSTVTTYTDDDLLFLTSPMPQTNKKTAPSNASPTAIGTKRAHIPTGTTITPDNKKTNTTNNPDEDDTLMTDQSKTNDNTGDSNSTGSETIDPTKITEFINMEVQDTPPDNIYTDLGNYPFREHDGDMCTEVEQLMHTVTIHCPTYLTALYAAIHALTPTNAAPGTVNKDLSNVQVQVREWCGMAQP